MTALSQTNRRIRWPRWLFAFALWQCLLPGCRTPQDNQIELLERELRTQEDYIYELEDYVVQYSERLRNIRCAQAIEIEPETYDKNSVLKKSHRVKDSDLGDSPSSDSEDRTDSSDDSPKPKTIQIEPEPVQGFDPDDFEPPPLNIENQQGKVIIGTTDGLAVVGESAPRSNPVTELELPDPVAFSAEGGEPEPSEQIQRVAVEDLFDDQEVESAHYAEQASYQAQGEMSEELPETIRVAQIFRNDEPGQPQTLLAVVEGYDAAEEAIPFAGEVSLMVSAPGESKPRRLKRWDFTLDDVSAAWQSSHLGDGLHLELPLEATKLPEEALQLWVRVINHQGEKRLARHSFERDRLAGLEVETGAKELTPDSPVQVAEDSAAEPESDEADPVVERLAAKSLKRARSKNSSGWRTSTVRTDMDAQGFDSTVKKTSGWTAQPHGGRYPHLGQGQETTTVKQGPIWTAGRVKRTGGTSAAKKNSPNWSPYR